MQTVYLETTFVSYLVSQPSRDLIVAAHQQLTRDWWGQRRHQFRCVISQVVLDEITVGDPVEIQKRLEITSPLDVLAASIEAESLTQAIMARGVLPMKAVRDAAHIAIATVYSVQYILTWNCRHIANAQILRRIERICQQSGYLMPLVCTPEELLEEPENA